VVDRGRRSGWLGSQR